MVNPESPIGHYEEPEQISDEIGTKAEIFEEGFDAPDAELAALERQNVMDETNREFEKLLAMVEEQDAEVAPTTDYWNDEADEPDWSMVA